MSNEVYFGDEARNRLKKGVDVVFNAVAPTLGARGRNAVYRKYNRPLVTNDGVSIARRIELKDPVESIGADLVKEAAEKTNEEAGDGTTTSVVIARALIHHGMKKLEDGYNPMVLRREIDQVVRLVVKKLKERAVVLKTDEELLNIATVSVESPEIGKIVAEAVRKVGIDGKVVVEESEKTSIEKEEVEGLSFDQGYTSPFMVSNPEKMEAVLTNVPVLVTDKSYNLNSDFFPLLESLHKTGCDKLLVIAEEVSGELLQSLVANRMKGLFHTVVVKKPYHKEVLEDIALVTGGVAVTGDKGIVNITTAHLGSAQKVIVKKDSTIIVGGAGHASKVEERIKELKQQLKDADHTFDKDKLKDRIAKLTGGVVVIKVGAPTESEMKYLKLKIDDAVASTKAALEEGIIPGGGVTLYEIASELDSEKTVGASLMSIALDQPFLQILKNSGADEEKIFADISGGRDGSGYNALTDEYVPDMMKEGIIDPVKVTRSAVVNAASLAGVFLTTEVVIADILEAKDDTLKV